MKTHFEAQDALFSALPVGFLFMIVVSILLFGKIRQPLIIWLTVPLALIGVTASMLLFDGKFDFHVAAWFAELNRLAD